MKRISMFTIAVLMLVPSVSNARYYGVSFRFRTRYSPYAFSYKYPVGLISGELQYSPYAAGYHRSGLVPYWFRYSPYAFSHKHPSGLISNHGSYYYLPYGCYPYAHGYRYSGLVDCDTHHNCNNCSYGKAGCPAETKNNYEKRLNSQKYRTRRLTNYGNRTNMVRETDGKEIIYNYLKSKNIDDFEVDRIFRANNKIVSVNFVLRDKNLIIKYWNPEQTQVLNQQSGHRRNYYEKYEQNWRNFSQKYKQTGGKVYQITSANGKEILSKLLLCLELNEG